MEKKKPTRRDLLIVIGQLQDMIGRADGLRQDDRDMSAHEKEGVILNKAFKLCVEARSFDPPICFKSKNGWGG